MAGLLGTALVAVALLADRGPAREATFPGPNGLLAYTLSPDLWVVNPDGSGARAVTRGLPVRAFQPAWSADGTQIAFTNTVVANGGIWVVRADGTGARRVTTESTDSWATWSPDRGRIAFVRQPAGDRRTRLFVVNADGRGLRLVTGSIDLNVDDPEWSPDGTKFVFSDFADIYVVNADGSGLRKLTGAGTPGELRGGRYPSWSPDGTRIAFAVLNEVRVVGVDGTGNRALAGGFREVWEVSWSPDGTKIAFVNDPAGSFQEELYTMNSDGSGVTRLGVDTETTVAWGRASTAVQPPQVARTANVAPVSGVVTVRPRGTARFVRLTALRQIPVGSEVDTTRGRVRLTAAAGGGKTQIGDFFEGRFILSQTAGRRPVATMRLSGPLACPKGRLLSGVEQRRKRRLWGSAKGRFRTKGRFASAAVRGTVWLTEDSCDGTLVRVRAGRLEVFDAVKGRRILLRAGQSYFARAR